MHFPAILAIFSLVAAVLAAPHKVSPRQAPGAQNVVYWGQDDVENNDLATYCTSTAGIDIIVLAFLYEFGNGNEIASGTIGDSCYISPTGEGQNCAALATAIDTCKSNGVKVIVSLGGASSSWSLSSQAEAEAIGQNLWLAYGNTGASSIPRPFGKTFVNGWDFDIENNSGNQYFQYMISTLRSKFASDPDNTYYVTAAPQCPLPEPNMEIVIVNSQFDYLWVQFYNNNGYPCATGFNGNGPLNYNQWVANIAGTPSANAKIFIGVPASPLASDGTEEGATYYLIPELLASLVDQYKSHPSFGGVMMWDAGYSDSNIIDGCNYAQQAKHILLTGSPCGSSGPLPPVSSSTTTTHKSTSTTTKAATTTTHKSTSKTAKATTTTSHQSTSTTAKSATTIRHKSTSTTAKAATTTIDQSTSTTAKSATTIRHKSTSTTAKAATTTIDPSTSTTAKAATTTSHKATWTTWNFSNTTTTTYQNTSTTANTATTTNFKATWTTVKNAPTTTHQSISATAKTATTTSYHEATWVTVKTATAHQSTSTTAKTATTTIYKATSTSTTSTPTGGIAPLWGQCGGTGYTGPTQCISPYTCVFSTTWWSMCQ